MSTTSRLAPLSGVAAVVLLEAGLFSDPTPWVGASDGELERSFGSISNVHWLVSAALIAVSALLFLVFTATVTERFAAAGSSPWTQSVIRLAGTAYGTAVLVGAGLYAAPAVTVVFGDAPHVSPEVYRGLFGTYNGVLDVCAPFAVALLAVTCGVAALTVPALPRWVAVASFVLAPLTLTSGWAPQTGSGVWFLVVSIALAVRSRTAAETVAIADPGIPVPSL